MPGASVAAIDVAVAPDAWAALGFTVDGGACAIGQTVVRLGGAGTGLTGWALRDAGGEGPVDGIPTIRSGDLPHAAGDTAHANTALAVDHVVVTTPDIDRTFAALGAAGMTLRRERAAGSPERPLRQGFFRHGECIVEVVGPQDAEPGGGPAALWGLTIVVADLDAAADLLGERLGTIRDAVQPGRRIATVRREALPGVPLALITPDAG